MIKNLVIGILTANLGFAYWIISNNVKSLKAMKSVIESLEAKLIDKKDICKELKDEINKQFYGLLFTRIRR